MWTEPYSYTVGSSPETAVQFKALGLWVLLVTRDGGKRYEASACGHLGPGAKFELKATDLENAKVEALINFGKLAALARDAARNGVIECRKRRRQTSQESPGSQQTPPAEPPSSAPTAEEASTGSCADLEAILLAAAESVASSGVQKTTRSI
jgi:hypothetical protein